MITEVMILGYFLLDCESTSPYYVHVADFMLCFFFFYCSGTSSSTSRGAGVGRSFTDSGKLGDSSTSSFTHSSSSSTSLLTKQSQQGSPPQTRTTRATTTNVTFTSPRDSSTPHSRTSHTPPTSTTTTTHTMYTPRTPSQFKDSFRSERTTRTTTHTSHGGGGTDEVPERSRSDEFLSQQRGGVGPTRKTDSSFTRTSTTYTSSTRGRNPSGRGGASPSASWRHGRQPHPPPQHPVGGASAGRPTSFSLHGLGDFDTLETRLQKALDSPTLLVKKS